jgi:hypothetical protein
VTFGKSQDKAALRYWTAARMKSAKGFSQANLAKALKLLQHPAPGSTPKLRVKCAPRNVPSGASAVPARGKM